MTSDSGGNDSWGPWYASESSTPSQFPSILQQQQPSHGRPRNGRKLLIAVIAGAVAIVAAIAAVIITVVLPGGSKQTTGFLPTGSSTDQDAQQTASAFLKAWDAGDFQQAANYTDHPAAAKAALETYKKYLHLRKLSTSVQSSAATGSATPRESVTFSATATVATGDTASALKGPWSYHGSFVTYQEKNGNYWYVKWAPDDLAPNLTNATHLAAVQVQPQIVSVTDSGGTSLTSYNDAGLNTISGLLMKQAPTGQGNPGLYVEVQTKAGKVVPNDEAVVIAPSNISNLSTTIDGKAENAARSAVSQHKSSSMVVIQPSTGKILAIANNDQQNDFALTAAVAPGSTMKVITSTALFNEGVINPDSGVACPSTFTIQGITYHNDQNESEPSGTPFMTDFAQSCNNAFTTQWSHLSGKLASTAKDYYGLNQKWDIGIGNLSASYFNAPASASGSELAQEAFGEGSLVASPIAMASVAATVDTGSFHQPYLVSGVQKVTAQSLPSQTDSWLKEIMRAVVTSGTAASLDLGSDVYAKTGTADIKGQEAPNSWLIAFDPSKDVAVADLVLNAGYGAQVAGPEVKSFLAKY